MAENNWEQKVTDIKKHKVDIFVMGHDWEGKFDFLVEHCDVHYLPRTENISSSMIKNHISSGSSEQLVATTMNM
ncbi:MAG: cytidyltransferase [Plesiomonas sp.]|uniref:cytidyltransferase n=1 Tax=Plesiomonas sp. TaxID=2486279 RepID=UPI003F3CA0F5